MKKTCACPKCNCTNIKIIKDVFHSNGAGNISKSKVFFRESETALKTFYICKNCGYVEEYLDTDELNKLN